MSNTNTYDEIVGALKQVATANTPVFVLTVEQLQASGLLVERLEG